MHLPAHWAEDSALRPGRPRFRRHWYTLLERRTLGADGRLTIFSPEIREKSFLARKQDYLRTAENIIGLKRGLLEPEIALGWRFGMPAETEEDLAAIRAKYMPQLEQLVEE